MYKPILIKRFKQYTEANREQGTKLHFTLDSDSSLLEVTPSNMVACFSPVCVRACVLVL